MDEQETPVDGRGYSFVCLPYLSMGDLDEINLGFLKIWNFDKKKDEYIQNPVLKDKITRLLNNYQTHFHPVKGMGMVTIGNPDFREFNPEELDNIRTARLILFIGAISQNNLYEPNANVGHSMFTSENFDEGRYRVVLNDDYISDQGGFIVSYLHGGIQIKQFLQKKPSYILAPFRFSADADLINSLLKLRQKRPRVFRTLMSAVEVFYESYYNAPNVSENARILLQASAFEILLSAPTNEGRKAMKAFVAKYINIPAPDSEKTYSYMSERKTGKVRERGTMKEIWADRFFTLRNHIIHGKTPARKDFVFTDRSTGKNRQRHIDIATFFFVFIVKKKIELSLRQNTFNDEIRWKEWTDDLSVPPKEHELFTYDRTSGLWRRLFHRLRKRRS